MIEAAVPSTDLNHAKPERSGSVGKSAQNAMGMEDFLRLLSTQIANQDPMEPMKDTEFIAQMASISSVGDSSGRPGLVGSQLDIGK